MKQKEILYAGLSLIIVLIFFTTLGSSTSDDQTELEIVSLKAGFGAVIVEIENVGSETAIDIASSIKISGGLFNGIDLIHVCDGCSVCGSTLAPGSIKSESSREAGFLFGIGPVSIHCTASAKNADMVSMTAEGTLIGPILIIN
jgi:hypothetical protein